MNLYKVYLRSAGLLNIVFVNADSLTKVPWEIQRRFESGAIVKIVQMYKFSATQPFKHREYVKAA